MEDLVWIGHGGPVDGFAGKKFVLKLLGSDRIDDGLSLLNEM
jgi:hypothetical protein